jgi:SAM-dependent methyltransferase
MQSWLPTMQPSFLTWTALAADDPCQSRFGVSATCHRRYGKPVSDERDTISRDAFARAVARAVDGILSTSDHHPLHGYTPVAFRHYVRRLALLGVLDGLHFESALDVGCAEGYFMSVIGEGFGADVWGVDISSVAARKAHERWDLPTAVADANRLPFADGAVDIVYSTEVIEHVLDPEVMLAEMRRVARRAVLVTTPVSQTPDEHEPDFELKAQGHVNNFDPDTIRRVFGPDATVRSFRCNATLSLIVAVGRYLPSGARDAFYRLDHAVSQHFGSPTRRFKPLRNRDWLITVPGVGLGDRIVRWACPACHGQLDASDGGLRCVRCAATYSVTDGVPDFVG